MSLSKYDFILNILENNKLTPSQNERVLKLFSKEIKTDYLTTDEIQSRLKLIEEKLGIKKQKSIVYIPTAEIFGENFVPLTSEPSKKNIEASAVKIGPYIYPSNLYKFLFKYNQNPVLKSTCHEIDTNEKEAIKNYCETQEYEFDSHLENILNAYKIHEEIWAPPFIKALIRGYLTGKDYEGNNLEKGWSSDDIKINWSTESLRIWASQNINLPPNTAQIIFRNQKNRGFVFEGFNSIITGRRVQTFTELVLHFKNLFHIRFDNSLHSILLRQNEINEWDKEIDFEIDENIFPKNIELFTDLDKLIQAYSILIKLIKEQHSINTKPKVRLSFYEVNDTVLLSIHHLDNKYNSTVEKTIDRVGQTYTNLIKFQINGLCNFYLRADFGKEGYAEINLWNDINKIKTTLVNFPGGVEHILEFPKK